MKQSVEHCTLRNWSRSDLIAACIGEAESQGHISNRVLPEPGAGGDVVDQVIQHFVYRRWWCKRMRRRGRAPSLRQEPSAALEQEPPPLGGWRRVRGTAPT